MKCILYWISFLLIFFLIIRTFKERFDGYGKSFGEFYYPIPNCKINNNCFAGSYIRNIPFYSDTNVNKKYKFNCCLDKHLGRHCNWKSK